MIALQVRHFGFTLLTSKAWSNTNAFSHCPDLATRAMPDSSTWSPWRMIATWLVAVVRPARPLLVPWRPGALGEMPQWVELDLSLAMNIQSTPQGKDVRTVRTKMLTTNHCCFCIFCLCTVHIYCTKKTSKGPDPAETNVIFFLPRVNKSCKYFMKERNLVRTLY